MVGTSRSPGERGCRRSKGQLAGSWCSAISDADYGMCCCQRPAAIRHSTVPPWFLFLPITSLYSIGIRSLLLASRNNDQQSSCFVFLILAHEHNNEVSHVTRVKSYLKPGDSAVIYYIRRAGHSVRRTRTISTFLRPMGSLTLSSQGNHGHTENMTRGMTLCK